MGGRVQKPAECDGTKAIHTGGSIIHELGGTLMGSDPNTSVLNKWCQAWDVNNLFVADGAPFPSNADKNPTLTIMANAWRVGDHILDRMRRKEL
jgi:choline dehydrogenase-like flavoprotein